MAGIYDVGDQTSGLPTYPTAPSSIPNPYSDPAVAQAAYDRLTQKTAPTPSLLGGALSSAYHGTLSELGGAAQAAGQATGLSGVADWGAGVAASQKAAADAAGRHELEGQWGTLPGFAYNLTKQLPMLAGVGLASKFGGGALARKLGVSAEAGGAIAGGAAMFPSAVGGNVEAAKAANNGQLSTADAYKALAIGLPEAAAQAFMPAGLAGVLEKGSEKGLAQRLLTGGLINGVVGAGQGAVTTALTGFMDPNKSIVERAKDIKEGAIQGGIGGAALGTIIHGLSGKKAPISDVDPNASTSDLDAATRSVDPEAAKAADAAAAPAPEPPKTLVPANDQPGVQLFTPEETTARAPQVAEMRKNLAKTYGIKGKDGQAFLDTIQAANQPELIAQVRDQADFYNEQKKGSMPKWFERLATDVGVLDKDGAVVADINKSVADRRALGDQTAQDAQEAFDAARADNTPQGRLKQKVAERTFNAALNEASDHHAEADRLEKLAADHAAADQLPSTFAQREMPRELAGAPQEGALWQSMMSISERGPSSDLRTAAFKASVALRRGDKNALDLAKKVQDDYAASQQERMSVKTDATAPTEAANEGKRGIEGARDWWEGSTPVDRQKAMGDAKVEGISRFALWEDLTPEQQAKVVAARDSVPTRTMPDFASAVKTDEPVTYAQRPVNDDIPYRTDNVNDNAPYKTDAANANERENLTGLSNDNPTFGTENVNRGARPVESSDVNSRPRIDEQLKREAANTDTSPFGERPEVTALKLDERPPTADNANPKFGTERTGEYKTDEQIENERMAAEQKKADAPRNARLLNDNVGNYDNLRPSPEALAFARDHSDYTGEQVPLAMHVIGPANKNQTPKQQAAIAKAKATREANAAARPEKLQDLVNVTKAAQKRAAQAEVERQKGLQKLVDDAKVNRELLKPSDPDILAKLAEPTNKRPGDDDIAYLVGNKDKPVNSAGTVLAYLAQHGDSDFVKLLASRLKKLGVDPTISFGSKEDVEAAHPGFDTHGLSAAYDEKANHIWLVDRTNLQSNFLHEMIHAVTHELIDKDGPLVDRLSDLRTRTMKHIADNGLDFPYGMTDLHEFVAEAFSNPEFQKLLADIPSARKTWTLWDAFKNAISKLLNLPERARSLLDDVIGTGSHLMNEYAGRPAKPGSVADSNLKATIFAKRADGVMDVAKKALQDDGFGVKTLAAKVRKEVLRWNTFTHIADMYGHALPALKRIQNAWEGRDVLQNRLHQLHKVARDAYNALPEKAQGAINTLMGWTRHGIDPRLNWEKHTWLHDLKDANKFRALVKQANDDWNTARNLGGDAAHAAYNMLDFSNKSDHYMRAAILADEYAKGAYRDNPAFAANLGELFRHDTTGLHNSPEASMNWWKTQLSTTITALEKVRDETISPKLKVGTKDEQKTAKKEFDAVDQLIKDINTKTKSTTQAPYFHEGRQGDFFVSADLNIGEDKNVVPHQIDALQKHLDDAGFGQYGLSRIGSNPSVFIKVKTLEQAKGLQAAFAEAQKKGLLNKEVEIKAGLPEQTKLWGAVAPQYVQRMVELAQKSPHFSAEAEHDLRMRWLDMLSDNSLPKAYQNRTEAHGWNKDMMHNWVLRSQVAAKSLSSAAMRSSVSDAMVQMDNEVQAHKAGTDVEKSVMASQVANEILQREMERTWKVDTTAVDFIRGLNHTFHLGFSLPYAVEQLSQIPMLLLPELGKTHGFVSSAKAIARVTPLAFKVMKAITSGPHALDAVITPEGLKKADVDPKTAAFLMDIVNRAGLDLGSFTREYGVAAKGGEEGALSKTMHMMNATAIYAETFGRVMAALSARELHGIDKEGHVEYAKQVLDQSMMSWQPWNTSRATSKTGVFGAYSPLALSFTGYQTRMIEKLYREVHDAIGGDTPETKAAARKFLAMHLGAATTLAGTLGMPFMAAFAGAASSLANFLTGDDRYDIEGSYRTFLANTFGKGVGRVVAGGLPHAVGLDLSDLGDQNLFPFTEFLRDRRKLEERAADWAKNAMGSPFATGLNVALGTRDIANGLPLQGWAKMLPTALKGPYDAARVAMYGYEDKNGTRKPIDTDVRDVLTRVAGFHTSEEGIYNERARTKAGLDETRTEREGYIRQRLLLAASHNDPEGYRQAVQDAVQFGKDHPLFQPMATFGTARSRQLAEQARARSLGMPLSKSRKADIEQQDRLNW